MTMPECEAASADVAWTLAVPPGDDYMLALLRPLVPELIAPCESCNGETLGTIFHSRAGVTADELEAAMMTSLDEVAVARAVERLDDYLGVTCANCGTVADAEAKGWRAYLDDDGQAATFCPECAEREFGGDE